MSHRSLVTVPLSSLFKHSKKLLLRECIHKSLYDPTYGYFSNKKSPLLQHRAPPQLNCFNNRAEYQASVASTYASSPHGWMTPVELFSPYLSRAIANRLRSLAPRAVRTTVIEIGAGRGTLARDILSHWEESEADFLSSASYYIIEISEAMTQLQRSNLQRWIDRGVVKIFNADAMYWFSTLKNSSEFRTLNDSHCHVLGTEVLDNMPHDLVRLRGNRLEQAELLNTSEDVSTEHGLSLEWSHEIDVQTMEAIQNLGILIDAAAKEEFTEPETGVVAYLRAQFEELIGGGTRDVWVPTASYQLLRAIVQALPHTSLTIGDFDSFPGALPGLNGPVVQSVERGSAIVFDAVHFAPFGKVDIMFPVRFDWLSRGHAVLTECERTKAINGKLKFLRRVISQHELFEDYGSERDKNDSTCRDGYNPVLQDFGNTSFLLVDSLSSSIQETGDEVDHRCRGQAFPVGDTRRLKV